MPITGLGSVFALGVESTWGTSVVATRRYPFVSESLTDSPTRIEPTNLRATTRLMTSADWRPGITTVGGDIQTQLYDRGLGLLFRAMLGNGATTGSSSPWTHEFTPTAALPSHTLYVSYGGDTTVPMKTFTGMVCSSWELSLEAGAEASLAMSWVGRAMTTSNTGTPAGTYVATPAMYVFTDGTVTYGGSSPGCVRSITFAGDNSQDAARVCIGQTTPAQAIENARRSYTGTMDLEFETWGGALAASASGAEAELLLALQVPSASNTLSIGANVRIDGRSAPIAGPDVVTVSVPFTVTIPASGTYAAKGLRIVAVNGEETIS